MNANYTLFKCTEIYNECRNGVKAVIVEFVEISINARLPIICFTR